MNNLLVSLRAFLTVDRLLDVLSAAAIVICTIGLFIIDISAPRGFLDGLGYPAIVALGARFGRRQILSLAILTSILTAIGPFLSQSSGISLTGDFANRGFSLLTIWIVAMVLMQRIGLQAYITTRENTLVLHQEALLDTVHQVLLADIPLQDRIRRLTEIAARSMHVGRVGVFRWREDDTKLVCLDIYRHPENIHETAPDMEENRHPDYLEAMRRELVAVANDVNNAPFLSIRRNILMRKNIRAMIGAGIFLDGELIGQITFSNLHRTREWTMQEIAFARTLAYLTAILFSANRNSETLSALDMVTEGIYATAETGTLLYANRAARRMAAATHGVAGGAPLPASSYPHPAVALEGPTDLQDVTWNGTEYEVQRVRLPRGGIITRINDVTARNAGVRESVRLQARLQQAAKMEAIGQLAGGIAHDFSNILSSIMGFARFLEDDLPPGSEVQTFSQRILAASERGKRLVNQVLDFAHARTVRLDRVDMGAVVRQAEDQVLATMPVNVTLRVTAEEGDAFIAGSAVQLCQLVSNLCINARDAIGERDGTIRLELLPAQYPQFATTASTNEVWIGAAAGDRQYACVRVSDTGDGITAQNLARIFEPFFTTKGRQRGTGLGLAVVHGAVISHHGLCHVLSEPGKGTIFSVYLPLAEASADIPASPRPARVPGSERVLLVDDEADIVEALSRGLCRMGYQALGLDDPAAVVRAVEEDAGWDVVVTDQMMPAMGGLELIRKIKTLRPDLLAILCTGYGAPSDEKMALLAGADAYIRKPVEADALARTIRRLRDSKAV